MAIQNLTVKLHLNTSSVFPSLSLRVRNNYFVCKKKKMFSIAINSGFKHHCFISFTLPSLVKDSLVYPKPTILLRIALVFAFGFITLIFAKFRAQRICLTISLFLIMVRPTRCRVSSCWERHLFSLTGERFLQCFLIQRKDGIQIRQT